MANCKQTKHFIDLLLHYIFSLLSGKQATVYGNGRQTSAVVVSLGNDPHNTWATSTVFEQLGVDWRRTQSVQGFIQV